MRGLKARLLGLVLFTSFVAACAYNWHMLVTEGTYLLKLSVLGPFGAIGGLFMLFFPQLAEPPARGDGRHLAMLALLMVIGFGLGGVNFHLMNQYRP